MRGAMKTRFAIAGCLLTVTFASATLAQSEAGDLRARAPGSAFAFVGGAQERATVDAAIERSIQHMNFIARLIARARLVARTRVYDTIAMNFPAGQIEVRCTGRPVFRSPDDGASVSWRGPDGETYRLAQRLQGDAVVQEVGNNDGLRRNTFRVSPDGHALYLRVVITSARLPAPIEFALTYRR